MRPFIAALIVLFALAPTRAAERPNIVLCMADDQGWGDVAYNGHPQIKTPVLDEMSRVGLRFDRFYAAAPVCSPTRGSVLTGRHPNRFGCFSWGHTLRPQEITLAEAVKTAGYATGHFGKWHLGSVRAESPVSPGNSGFDTWVSASNFYENDPLLSHNGIVHEYPGESSVVTVDLALDFIRAQTKAETPFLAVIWFGSPHLPHVAAEEDLALYPNLPRGRANYLGEITGIDRAMGKLRAELRSLNIADNTLLWYTSDNGAQGPGETGGLRGKKGSLWEGGIRVPAIIEWPAVVESPRQTDLPASTCDIYPTILDLLQVEMPNQPSLDGVSLRPLIEGKPFERSKPMGFWVHPTPGVPRKSHELLAQMRKEQQEGIPPGEDVSQEGTLHQKYGVAPPFRGHAAWLDGRWKLHQIPNSKPGDDTAGFFTYELYDLDADREEATDVATQHADRVTAMAKALEEWQVSVMRSLNREDYR